MDRQTAKRQRRDSALPKNSSRPEPQQGPSRPKVHKSHESDHHDHIAASSSATSSVFSKNSKRKDSSRTSSLVTNTKLTLVHLLSYLSVGLRDNALAQGSVNFIWKNLKRWHRDVAVCMPMVRKMYTVPANEEVVPLLFRNQNYMFYPFNNVFGYDQEYFRINPGLRQRSLASAMAFPCKNETHSLDLVFRESLKEIADELFGIDSRHGERVSLDVPHFISGKYLEIRLLQKIRSYYKEDIVTYLSSAVIDPESPLFQHINGSASELYIRTLYGRYQLRPNNADVIFKSVSLLPKNLRVWTDKDTQVAANSTLTTFLQRLHGDEVRRIERSEMVSDYVKAMKPVVAANKDFLAEVCRASELFAWMCFGIVTDDENEGTIHMAENHYLVKCEQADESGAKNPLIVWNYPLASMYQRLSSAVEEEDPVAVYIKNLVASYNRRKL